MQLSWRLMICVRMDPTHPASNMDVLVEMATLRFNKLADDIGYEPDVEAHSVLEVMCEQEAERQL